VPGVGPETMGVKLFLQEKKGVNYFGCVDALERACCAMLVICFKYSAG